MAFGAFLGGAGAVTLLWLPSAASERVLGDPHVDPLFWICFLGACLMFLVSGFSLWAAFRRFP
jgi:hypothetical protein